MQEVAAGFPIDIIKLLIESEGWLGKLRTTVRAQALGVTISGVNTLTVLDKKMKIKASVFTTLVMTKSECSARLYFPYMRAEGNLLQCVVMPLHEWATGSLPPAGRPPTRQVGPSEVHVSV